MAAAAPVQVAPSPLLIVPPVQPALPAAVPPRAAWPQPMTQAWHDASSDRREPTLTLNSSNTSDDVLEHRAGTEASQGAGADRAAARDDITSPASSDRSGQAPNHAHAVSQQRAAAGTATLPGAPARDEVTANYVSPSSTPLRGLPGADGRLAPAGARADGAIGVGVGGPPVGAPASAPGKFYRTLPAAIERADALLQDSLQWLASAYATGVAP